MKHSFSRLLCLLLAILTLAAAALTGCSSVDTSPAVSYGDSELSKAAFLYLCSVEKTSYLYEVYGLTSDQLSASQLQDDPLIWSATAADGLTAANDLKASVLQNVQIYLYMKEYAESQGYTLSAEQKKMVQDEFNGMLKSFKTKKAFNEYMAQYGIDYDALLEYNYLQTLAYQGNELLFGENGSMRVTEDSAKTYFNKNYITVGAIYVNTKNKTYANGKTVLLTETERNAKKKLASDLMARLQAGEDFAALCAEYSDSGTESSDTAGFTFEKGGFENAVAEEKAFSLAEGELASVEVDGGVYLLQRRALDTNNFEANKDRIRLNLENAKKFSLVADAFSSFKIDEEFMNGLDIAAMPHMV